jgi:hypothetical protein
VSRPDGLFLVTNAGMRIPIDVKLAFEHNGTRHWQPMIEGDFNAIMPSVVAIDGPPVHRGECLSFPAPGPGWDTPDWGRRVMANSTHVFGWYEDFENGVSA